MRMQDPLFHNYYPFQDRAEEHEANEKLLKAQGPLWWPRQQARGRDPGAVLSYLEPSHTWANTFQADLNA